MIIQEFESGRTVDNTQSEWQTQRTSVALPPFEVAQGLLSSLGVAQMSWERGGGRGQG